MRPVLALDCDGVIVDYVSAYLEAAHFWLRRTDLPTAEEIRTRELEDALQLDAEERKIMQRATSAEGFALRMMPYPGAVEAVRELHELANVIFVTAPDRASPTWAHDRAQWLQTRFADAKIISAHDKEHVYADVFVDDHPKHVRTWVDTWEQRLSRPALGLLWDRSYNRNVQQPDILRASSWRSIRILLEEQSALGFDTKSSTKEEFAR